MNRKRRYKRGYPVAILLGLEENYAILWQVYSKVVKHFTKIKIEDKRSDEKNLYNFHQSIIKKIKPIIASGVKTVIVSAPPKTSYSSEFLGHIRKHHRYLGDSKSSIKANFAEFEGTAKNKIAVAEIVKSNHFLDLLEETTSQEANHTIGILEKKLFSENDTSEILYTLKEIENKIYNRQKIAESVSSFLILTDNYLTETHNKGRIHRLIQIANNQNIQTKIIKADSAAGNRVTQFGGIIFFNR